MNSVIGRVDLFFFLIFLSFIHNNLVYFNGSSGLLGRTRMGDGRQRGQYSQKSLRSVIAGVLAETHQHAISQFLQIGQAKREDKLQLHSIRERRSKNFFLMNDRFKQ